MKRPRLAFPEQVGWRDHLVGGAMALVYVAWLLSGARRLGFPRDEGVYFRAGASYWRWYRLLFEHGWKEASARSAIDSMWADNHEHPALMKTLFGASEYFFHEKWHVFADASTAFRLPGMAMGGLALWITYLFGARAFGRRAGVIAAALLALMPQVFFHAHLACFDVPIATMWIGCVYVHWRSLERRRWGGTLLWALLAGVVYGLTLETKHNAWILPLVVVPHGLFVSFRSQRAGRLVLPWGLLAMATVGPAVFVGLWPYLWYDTLARVEWWRAFHIHHEFYNIEFLGRNYFGPPSPKSYVPVMIAATVPSITLVLFITGLLERVRTAAMRLATWVRSLFHRPLPEWTPPRDPLETDLLLGLAFGGSVGVFFLSDTPIFGGTKHWLPAYPALAIIAGRGFELVVRAADRALPALEAGRRRALHLALAASVLVGPLAITAHSHPFGISAYVPLVGGTKGGAELGLNRQFWGYTTQTAAEEFLNPQASKGALVFVLDTTWEAWAHMQEEGRVRSDLRVTPFPGEATYSLVQHELHMSEVDYDIWIADGTDAPVYVVTHDDVPMVSIYPRR